MEQEKEVNHYELWIGNKVEKYNDYLKMKERSEQYIRSRRARPRIRAYAIFNDDTFMEVFNESNLSCY